MTEKDFAALAERHRRELHVHCYRMLASFDEAEDAVQETFLRAWRTRASFEGGPHFRAWLYRIATNVCLDVVRGRSRGLREVRSLAEVPWLQPYPDRLLDEVAPSADQPDAVAVSRETIELAFLAALQVLPPRQRAALILGDVLGWPASETATLLDTSVRRPTPRCNAPARPCSGTCPRAAWSGRRRSRPPRSGSCSIGSSTRTSAATRWPPLRSRRGTSGSRCRRTR